MKLSTDHIIKDVARETEEATARLDPEVEHTGPVSPKTMGTNRALIPDVLSFFVAFSSISRSESVSSRISELRVHHWYSQKE
jgi:hypothetical protein